MVCPACLTENEDGACVCSHCSSVFPRPGEAETQFDPIAAGPVSAPASRGPSPIASAALPVRDSAAPPASDDTLGSRQSFSATLVPGADFGPRYHIESILGRGGMGAVYKAYDKELDRLVALKLVRPDLASDDRVMQRFKQELLLASRISHKNILRIHDLGDVDGVKFISMAYIEGADLHGLVQREGRLPLEKTLTLARQLCAGLAAAHAEGVVHRDLKPQNVLIDGSGNAYISDFGLAKSLDPGEANLTHVGILTGTPKYMAPEQVEAKPADHRSDLYALGLILYEMLTGKVPFKGDSAVQVMYHRLRHTPQDPRSFNPEVPNYLARVIMRCLERDPERRYQNAADILNDIETQSAQSGKPYLSRAISNGWVRSAGAALVVAALVLAVPRLRNLLIPAGGNGQTGSRSEGIPAQGKYIAVLPFRVLGEATSLGYVAEGLQDALSAKLFQLQGTHIVSADAVEKAQKTGKESLSQLANELGANLIVEGTIQQAGGKISIIASLHDMRSGKLLRSQEFRGVPQDLLTLEDEIYADLLGALELRPSIEEMARAARHPTENSDAYDEYLKGRDALRGSRDAQSAQKAIGFYEAALKDDPTFALAYTGIADASLALWAQTKDRFWTGKALHAAQMAQQLSDDLPEVHVALGDVYRATGKAAESIEELQRAVQLEPNSDDGYRRLGQAYLDSGRKADAIQAYQRAAQIDRFYWLNQEALGEAYFNDGDFLTALDTFRRVTELAPANPIGYEDIGDVYFRQGKYGECIPQFQKALQIRPSYDAYSNLGTVYFYLKRYGDAVKMFEKAVEMSPNQEVTMGNLADSYRWSGQRDKADATYDKAIALAFQELQVNPRDANALQDLALYYAKKGDAARALKFIRSARAINAEDVYGVYVEGVVQAIAGHKQEAIQSLQEAFKKGFPTSDAENDPELKDLQGQAEFQKLVGQFAKKAS
jgi:serine/threonine protein kinase/tetratricopeptide (TPR) repeat protein